MRICQYGKKFPITYAHGDFFGSQHGLIYKALHHYESLIKVPFCAVFQSEIPAGSISTDLQSTVDLAPTFLNYASITTPRYMTGLNQKENWNGNHTCSRKHVLVENQQQQTTFHVATIVNERYKLTVYRNANYGELYDLESNPDKSINCWEFPEYTLIKSQLLQEFVQ